MASSAYFSTLIWFHLSDKELQVHEYGEVLPMCPLPAPWIYLGEKAAATCLWSLVLVLSQYLCNYKTGRSHCSSWQNRQQNGGRGQSPPPDSSHSGRPNLGESMHIQGAGLSAVPWATAPKQLLVTVALQMLAPLFEVGIIPLADWEGSQHLKYRKIYVRISLKGFLCYQ